MPVLTTRPVLAAVRGLLAGAGLTVLDGGVGDPVAPCVVLWPEPGTPQASSLGDPVDALEVSWTTVAVGETTDQAMWVADRVTTTLTRATVTVAGRTSHPITMDYAGPVSRDDDLTPPLMFAATRWRLLNTP